MKTYTAWNLEFDTTTTDSAISAAKHVFRQVTNVEPLQSINKMLTDSHKYYNWGNECSFGIGLLGSYLNECFPTEGFDKVAHTYVGSTAKSISATKPINISMSRGLAGLGFTVRCLSCNGTRYQKLTQNIDSSLDAIADAVRKKLDSLSGIVSSDYDVVSGLSGVAAYLMSGSRNFDSSSTLRAIIETFIKMSLDPSKVSRYHTPRSMIDEFFPVSDLHRKGMIDCGLAHGVAGPLAVLAMAAKEGVLSIDLEQAIRKLGDLLIQVMRSRSDRNWPAAVGISDDGFITEPDETTRDAWCYGAPGVSRALWLAGNAIHDESLKSEAVMCIKESLSRSNNERFTMDCCFCHGLSGLLQISNRFYTDTGDAFFREKSGELIEEILVEFDEKNPFGFKSFSNDKWIDDPRLFEGAIGTALVLISTVSKTAPSWDRFFLLS